jgi:hypothetical protein
MAKGQFYAKHIAIPCLKRLGMAMAKLVRITFRRQPAAGAGSLNYGVVLLTVAQPNEPNPLLAHTPKQ